MADLRVGRSETFRTTSAAPLARSLQIFLRTSTESLPPQIRETPSDCLYYIFYLTLGLSKIVSEQAPEGSKDGEKVVRSTEEAGVRIFGYQRCEFLHGFHFRSWFIAVPLQISTLPENSPDAPRSDVCRLRHRRFVFLIGRSPPDRSDLENFNALPDNTEAKIQLRANVWRGSTLLHEGIHCPAYSRQLNLSERHGRYATFCKLTVWALSPTLRHFLTALKIAARLSMLGLPLGDSIR